MENEGDIVKTKNYIKYLSEEDIKNHIKIINNRPYCDKKVLLELIVQESINNINEYKCIQNKNWYVLKKTLDIYSNIKKTYLNLMYIQKKAALLDKFDTIYSCMCNENITDDDKDLFYEALRMNFEQWKEEYDELCNEYEINYKKL